MANHVRRQIREAIGTAVTGLTTTGARVYQSRVYPVQAANLPCLLVYTESEQVRTVSIAGPAVLQRTVRVQVDAVAATVTDLDDTLDGICKEVEIALAGLNTGVAAKHVLVATELELQGTSDQPIGRARMTYEVDYFTTEDAPDAAL
jgi:hypothetical protein